MQNSTYIWLPVEEDDSYAEFQDTFIYKDGPVTLEITADYQFAAFVNGAFAANSQYADLPDWKAVSRYDITALCRAGENILTVKASHPGQEYFQSRKMPACVRYAVYAGEECLAASSADSLCREDPAYTPGELITPQLGRGYVCDLTAEPTPWGRARVVAPGFAEMDKPIENTYLVDMPAVPALYGAYTLAGGETAGEKMQRAWQRPLGSMADRFPLRVQCSDGDGVYILCDVGEETAGYPYLTIECAEPATVYLGWGEHLTDGRLRTHVGPRSFAVTLRLKAGRNEYTEYLRRFGARYLCLYVQSTQPVTVHSAGILEERYPFRKPAKDFGDRLFNRLYETGRRTLELCAHQHYEDCPWREQALYGMDSRNQMLFGYGAFGETAYPRANLRLLARGIGEDGLLHLCPPSTADITIPSFSAYFVVACRENARAELHADFVADVLPAVERIMAVFRSQTKDGAVHTFGPRRYWNFHEWSEGLDGVAPHRDHEVIPEPDGPLSAICCRAAEAAAELEQLAGNAEKSATMREYADTLAAGLQQFYVKEKGLFASYQNAEHFHELTQALMLFTGRLQGEEKKAVIAALKSGAGLVPITLSGMAMKYEGLLKCGEQDYVVEDMVRRFAPMLTGSTYWETALGQRDFDNAGSLCHGWSSVPCYVLDYIYGGAV